MTLYGQIGDYELDLSHAPLLNRIQESSVMSGLKNNIPINLKINKDLTPSSENHVREKLLI